MAVTGVIRPDYDARGWVDNRDNIDRERAQINKKNTVPDNFLMIVESMKEGVTF